jgi:hypothetical protein
MTTPAEPSAVDAEIARLMRELGEGRLTLCTLREAVALTGKVTKRQRKSKAPPKSPEQLHRSRLLGRYKGLLTRLRAAQAIVAASRVSNDWSQKWAAISPETSISSLEWHIRQIQRDHPALTAEFDAGRNTTPNLRNTNTNE